MLLAEFGTGQVFWSMLWFFMWVIWIYMLVVVFGDIFGDRELSGWGKAGWTLFVIVLPFLGVFVYLIARGPSMAERRMEDARRADAAMRDYVRGVTADGSNGSTAAELERLVDLRDRGVIDEADFQAAKAKTLA
jgi:hypothetical protein